MDPVSFLEHHCRQHSYELDFVLISETKSQKSEFVYECYLQELSTRSVGTNKKFAKQNAAMLMIADMLGRGFFESFEAEKANDVIDKHANKIKQLEEKRNALNEIDLAMATYLAQLCARQNLSQPIYEVSAVNGDTHNRIYKISCYLETFKHKVFGEGTNKKEAKRQAALNMFEFLHGQNFELSNKIMTCLNHDVVVKEELDKSDFMSFIKMNQIPQKLFEKLTFDEKCVRIYKKFSKCVKIIDYIENITDKDPKKFITSNLEDCSAEKLKGYIQDILKCGNAQFLTSISFDDENFYTRKVFFSKNDYVFFSWFGKASDRIDADKCAYGIALKTLIEHILSFKGL